MLKFSVVIPIYNASSTLVDCVKTILNQEYNDIEIVLVNDGSVDNSLDICLNFKRKDSRIKLINKKNEGVARARNDGLKVCTGDYVYFVDPDDLVESNIFLEVSPILKEKDIDILVFGHRKKILNRDMIYSKDIVMSPFTVKNNTKMKQNYLTQMYLAGVGFSAWDKIIRIDFLKENNISFPLLKRGQDMAFCAKVFEKSSYIVCLDKIFYTYLDFNSTGTNKTDPNIIQNHQYIFACLTKIFMDDEAYFYTNAFLQTIYLKWFFYVIPNNILNSENNFMTKKNQMKNIYTNDLAKYIQSKFKIKDALGEKNKVMLLILKYKLLYLHILLIKIVKVSKPFISRYRRISE